MQRICAASGQPFEITPEDIEFYKKISPKIGGKIFELPLPTLCPEERERRRLVWRNERCLYSRKCDSTGKNIISEYPAGAPFPVFDLEYYFKREWEVPEREFSFEKPFFQQFSELLSATPRAACLTDLTSLEHNSVYQNAASRNKNCYLVFATGDCQDCMYGESFDYCKNCLDGLFVRESELCYECVDCLKCHELFFAQDCIKCSESAFLFDCRNCHHCFGCAGLQNKWYCLYNEQLSPQEYKERIASIRSQMQTSSGLALHSQKLQEVTAPLPRKYAHIENSEDSNGDYIYDSKNIHLSFMVYDSQDCRYCLKLIKGKDCIDVSDWGDPGEMLRECVTVGKNAYSLFFCNNCWPGCSDLLYCDSCSSSRDLFGCIGLHQAQYCIFNKQYSKEEYEKVVPKIIEYMLETGELGEFFPIAISPFAYNETIAQEYYPLIKDEVLAKGWKWRDETHENPKVEKIILANLLPESITDIPDDILNWAIQCEETAKPFIIQKSELEFYRKMQLPIPRFHPDVRHAHRLSKRNPRKLWDRNCDNCGKSIQTAYHPSRPERVFCEECYQKEVY